MDSILYWNAVAIEANRISLTNGKGEQPGPVFGARALAIVHLAMYDAYFLTAGGLPPYLSAPPLVAPAGSNADSAVAGAAHAALHVLFPSQRAFFDQKLSEANLRAPGADFGRAVALRLIQNRQGKNDDAFMGSAPHAFSAQRGRHRPDPDNPAQGIYAPLSGGSRLFAAPGPRSQYDLDAPPSPTTGSLGAPKYRKALQQVRYKGIAPELAGTLPPVPAGGAGPRIPDDTLIGIFWGYDGAAELGTPPRLYNQLIRQIAIGQGNSVAQNAELFARVNAAMADAGILAWANKYEYDFWRPVVGIREHDTSFGPEPEKSTNNITDEGDPFWLPLGAPATNSLDRASTRITEHYPCNQGRSGSMKNFTPPFPAYPSGHASFGAAAFRATEVFYEKLGKTSADVVKSLGFVSDELNGVSRDNQGTVRPRHERRFKDLQHMIIENGVSRVYLGVHWVFDAFDTKPDGSPDLTKFVGGVPLGTRIAEQIAAAALTESPV
jgi:membrane-associated phospholipid phosphatase